MDFAEEIKARLPTREVMEREGIRVGRGGMARCPFHGDRDASMKVYDDLRRGWHCFGCGAGGDVIAFAQAYYNIGFRAALDKLNHDFALGLPIGEPVSDEQRRAMQAEAGRRKARRDALNKAYQDAENAYWAAFDAVRDNDKALQDGAPRGPFDEMSEAFCEAIVRRDELMDALSEAEEEWRIARARRYAG